jgi:glutamate racemase
LIDKIRKYTPDHINIVEQGTIIADSLADYLNRHPEMDIKCSKNGSCSYLTTEDADKFNSLASIFLNENIDSKHINL